MGVKFAKIIFEKLIAGPLATAFGTVGFKKLSTESDLPALTPDKFDLNFLKLQAGAYTITVTAVCNGLEESDHSDPVFYAVN